MGSRRVAMVVKRFEVFLVNLDPTVGSEIKKTRPCLVISPDQMNLYINTVIVAPMTTKGKPYPTRVGCKFQGKQGMVILDQIRTVDKIRLVQKVGRLDTKTQAEVLRVLGELFAP
jgi:mRNA interferase MazF